MSVHLYTRAIHQKTIKNMLLNDANFKPNLKLCCIVGSDQIRVEFINPLTGSEKLRLDTLVGNLPTADLDVLIDINMKKISKFADKLIDEYGKKNIKRGYTEAQIRSVNNALVEVVQLMKARALPTVLTILQSFTPTLEIPQSDLDEFILDISEFLGTL